RVCDATLRHSRRKRISVVVVRDRCQLCKAVAASEEGAFDQHWDPRSDEPTECVDLDATASIRAARVLWPTFVGCGCGECMEAAVGRADGVRFADREPRVGGVVHEGCRYAHFIEPLIYIAVRVIECLCRNPCSAATTRIALDLDQVPF